MYGNRLAQKEPYENNRLGRAPRVGDCTGRFPSEQRVRHCPQRSDVPRLRRDEAGGSFVTLLQRFAGAAGRGPLIEALQAQRIVGSDPELAERIAERAEILELSARETLITQGSGDNDVYFILVGEVEILVKGRWVAFRRAGLQVGEISAIDPSCARTATVVAMAPTVVARLSEAEFVGIADAHP